MTRQSADRPCISPVRRAETDPHAPVPGRPGRTTERSGTRHCRDPLHRAAANAPFRRFASCSMPSLPARLCGPSFPSPHLARPAWGAG